MYTNCVSSNFQIKQPIVAIMNSIQSDQNFDIFRYTWLSCAVCLENYQEFEIWMKLQNWRTFLICYLYLGLIPTKDMQTPPPSSEVV